MEVAAYNGDENSQERLAEEFKRVGIDSYRKIVGRTNALAESRITKMISNKQQP
jgi:dissimilatory sulfite reductase (desulfoviridin) alpha/beta subunit